MYWRQTTRLNIWTLRSSCCHCFFLKPFSHQSPRRQSPQSDRPHQLLYSGVTFMSIMTSTHTVAVDMRPNNRQCPQSPVHCLREPPALIYTTRHEWTNVEHSKALSLQHI
ncbi:hypothetical protein TNCV_4377301 [Trichonephila clavipes]|nr:hypothetical protein TNCV_4377301 [Trichonephila clavipes]